MKICDRHGSKASISDDLGAKKASWFTCTFVKKALMLYKIPSLTRFCNNICCPLDVFFSVGFGHFSQTMSNHILHDSMAPLNWNVKCNNRDLELLICWDLWQPWMRRHSPFKSIIIGHLHSQMIMLSFTYSQMNLDFECFANIHIPIQFTFYTVSQHF